MKNPFRDDEKVELRTKNIEPDSWGCLVEGYYWSLKILLKEILNSNMYQNRWVSYPVMFNIRHYYELSLKDILVNLERIEDSDYLIMDHNLDVLLDKVESALEEYINLGGCNEYSEREETEIINAFLIIKREMRDFVDLDNSSFSFRYPYSKSGKESIGESYLFDVKRINESFSVCRKKLTRISTMLICDKNNKIFE